ncbi:MAG: hypothetical protein Ct9H300mP1_39320 [Planctomycetaceae bacterium]|nr:MAG: hypothetical protein Ct9H300mP1_39320 [Planctomycetaceae bacterium]
MRRCLRCHGSRKRGRGLRLDSRKAAILGGKSGPSLVVGKPATSLLIPGSATDAGLKMPREASCPRRRSGCWNAGFGWGRPGRQTCPRELSPKRTHGLPARRPWNHPMIQRLVGESDRSVCRVEGLSTGLKPVGGADPLTLIRRVYYDLVGLPPAWKDVEDFRDDHSESAYRRVY